jgi:hypothetical protein
MENHIMSWIFSEYQMLDCSKIQHMSGRGFTCSFLKYIHLLYVSELWEALHFTLSVFFNKKLLHKKVGVCNIYR